MKKIVTLITGFAIIMSLCCASFAVNQPDDAKTDSEVALSQNVDLSGKMCIRDSCSAPWTKSPRTGTNTSLTTTPPLSLIHI